MVVAARQRAMSLVLIGLLAGAVLGNMADLLRIEHPDRGASRALVRAESPELGSLGLETSPTVRHRRGLYLLLLEHAPYATILVEVDFELPEWQLRGLGRAETIVGLPSGSTERLAGLDVTRYVVADDEDGRFGPVPFSIALDSGAPDTLVVRNVEGRWEFIDLRLVPDDLREDLLP